MSAYVIVDVNVNDAVRYEEYKKNGSSITAGLWR